MIKMNAKKKQTIFVIALLLIQTISAFSHPTGNMITVGDDVLWPYIYPIDDTNHKASILIWNKNTSPKIFLQSEHSASDFMLYNNKDDIYIVERRFLQTTQSFEMRLLKTTVNTQPTVIWNWIKDDWRIGEGGFVMLTDNQMIFARHPEIYSLKKGEKPKMFFEFDQPIKRIRAVAPNQILLMNDSACFMVQHDGTLLKQWLNLIDKDTKNTPLNRNQIFDADYNNGKLLFAYWGKRTFEVIEENGKQQTLLNQTEPFTPHWVAFLGNEKLLFSSKLVFDGSTPKPYLIKLNEINDKTIIWEPD